MTLQPDNKRFSLPNPDRTAFGFRTPGGEWFHSGRLSESPIRVFHGLCLALFAGAVLGFLCQGPRAWALLEENPALPAAEPGGGGSSTNMSFSEAAATPDQDGDGIPDEWELAYYHDPANPDDGGDDFDGDGLTAYQEHVFGTSVLGKWQLREIQFPGGLDGWTLEARKMNAGRHILINAYSSANLPGDQHRIFLLDADIRHSRTSPRQSPPTPSPGEISMTGVRSASNTIPEEAAPPEA